MLLAAAAGLWMVPSTKADFVVTTGDELGNVIANNGAVGSETIGGVKYNIYIIQALNNGANGTGSDLLGANIEVDSTKPILVDLTDTNGDGLADANVFGQNVGANGNDAFFGSGAGTFIGVSDASYTKTNFSGEQTKLAYVNAQTGNNQPGDLAGNSAIVASTAAVSGRNPQPAIPIDSAFTSSSVTALQVAATLGEGSSNFTGGIQANSTSGPAPFANIVVPAGTAFTVTGQLSSDAEGVAPQTFSLSIPNGGGSPSTGAKVSTSTAAANTVTGTISITGKGNGSYNESTVTPSNGVTGSIALDPFSPSTDEEIYGLRILEGGSVPTNGDLTTIVNELNVNLAGQGTASLTAPGTSGSVLPSSFFDVFVDITSPAINSNGTGFFNYDLSQSATAADSPLVVAIGVVPEPTGVGVLLLGGFGLLARRRKMNQIEG
jgi:hypothetical protein